MPFESLRSHVAVVELSGVIGTTLRVRPYERLFSGLRQSRRTKAVVLDIDSPGGSASASEDLYLGLRKLSEAKPLVAFIRGQGTSGAYLLSCAAPKIIALPSALIGSIGVISIRPVLEDLLRRIGVDVEVNKSGRLKDMGAFHRKPTAEETEKLQALLDEFYDVFVKTVAERRHITEEQARGYATGEVFTARKGLSMGLVDELGDLDAAVDSAASQAGIRRRVAYPRLKRPWRERMMERLTLGLVEAAADAIEARLAQRVYYM